MKKLFTVLFSLVMIMCVFAGCSASSDDATTLPNGEVPTDDATITESNAINCIKDNYTFEELGLDGVDESSVQFMVKSNGVMYDGDKYVCVDASIMTENEGVTSDKGEKTYSKQDLGEYLISFDGSKVLKKDMTAEEDTYTELENRVADYAQKEANSETSAESENTETTKAE